MCCHFPTEVKRVWADVLPVDGTEITEVSGIGRGNHVKFGVISLLRKPRKFQEEVWAVGILEDVEEIPIVSQFQVDTPTTVSAGLGLEQR